MTTLYSMQGTLQEIFSTVFQLETFSKGGSCSRGNRGNRGSSRS